MNRRPVEGQSPKGKFVYTFMPVAVHCDGLPELARAPFDLTTERSMRLDFTAEFSSGTGVDLLEAFRRPLFDLRITTGRCGNKSRHDRLGRGNQ
jgi:hypothetical protein